MIEFTSKQETKMVRRDCRAWTELLAAAWYGSALPGALDYPASALVEQMREVYMACHNAGIDNIEAVSQLGFDVLRANLMGADAADVSAMARYFIQHAKGDNVDYAQNWIDLYLQEDAP